MATIVQKSFTPSSKDIRYLNRDFPQLREALINFAKVYYPNTYKDFSPSSPGMMFIEQAAYVGDVLSYYTDYVFKEGTMESATERKNIIGLARYLGYKIKPSTAATGIRPTSRCRRRSSTKSPGMRPPAPLLGVR